MGVSLYFQKLEEDIQLLLHLLQGDTVKIGQGSKLATDKKSTIFLQTPSNLVYIPSHEKIILTKFHDVWRKIVDFLLVDDFEPGPILSITYYSWDLYVQHLGNVSF